MNLEVDVMEGDVFFEFSANVYQEREGKTRAIEFRTVHRWSSACPKSDGRPPIDLPTFTRYCQGCGLTVKEVKPETVVETIKPPEWAVVTRDGVIVECESEKARNALMAKYPHEKYKPVRIDWGAK